MDELSIKITLLSYEFIFDISTFKYSTGELVYEGCDGYITYSYRIVNDEDNIDYVTYLYQPFKKGITTQMIDNFGYTYNVWNWNGDKDNPTILPSFLVPDLRLHLFVRNGKLDILPDTTIDTKNVKRK